MKKYTGYPSIDRRHEDGLSFLKKKVVVPDMSIYNAFNVMSIPYRKDDAIDCLDLTVTFDELIDNAKIISKSFKELGIKKGDIVVVSMPNFYQAVATFFAANKIGATLTFLNSQSTIEEVKHYLNLFESPLLINYDRNEEYNQSIKKDTKVRQIITLKNNDLNRKDFNLESNNIIGYNDLISFSDLKLIGDFYNKPFSSLYGGKENALILFTSGTTGNPKAVVLTNKNVLSSGMYMKASANLSNTRGEKSLVCVPFTYPYGFATSTLMSLLCGREAVLAPDITAVNIPYYLKKNPNIIFGSPALLELIKRNTPKELNLSSVDTFISGGDFLTPSQSIAGKKFFNDHGSDVKICNGSGNAETVGASTNAVGQKIKIETVGKILVGSTAIVIEPETGKELKYGEEGLLCISGGHVFKEYFKEPELTKEAKFVYKGKEYLKTGTRGFLDEEGYFTLTGRDSRFYIMSTLNKVYCDRVQLIMSSIDVIDSVTVVKKPDDEMLFTAKAYIVLKDGILPTKETEAYIKQKCTETIILANGEEAQLKPYEIPTSIDFIEKVPRTVADKINYPLLEKQAVKEYEEEKTKKRILKK